MRAAVFLAFALWVAASNVANADATAAAPREVQALADQFFAMIKDGHAGDAFRSAMVGLGAAMGDGNTKAISTNTEESIRKLGGVVDWKLLRTRTVTPDLVEQVYLLRCGLAPEIFRIFFYTSGARWRMVDIRMGTPDEAARGGYLPMDSAAAP